VCRCHRSGTFKIWQKSAKNYPEAHAEAATAPGSSGKNTLTFRRFLGFYIDLATIPGAAEPAPLGKNKFLIG